MGSSTLFATVLSLMPLFQAQTDRPIVTFNPDDHPVGQETQAAVRDAMCEQLGLRPCHLSPSDFPYVFVRGGSAQVIQSPYGPHGGMEMCLVSLPSSKNPLHLPYTTRYIGHSQEVSFEEEQEHEKHIPAFNLLTQLAQCASDVDTQAHKERNVAFAALMLQLLVGDKDFIGPNDYSLSEQIAYETQSTVVSYANAAAQRILAEEYKKNIVSIMRRASQCSVVHKPSNQPWFEAPSVQTAANFNYVTNKCTTGGDRIPSGLTISVDDEYVTNAYNASKPIPESALVDPRDRDEGQSRMYDPMFTWSPVQNFDGSLERGFWYSWRTANSLSGIQ
jgi:hypothetical protein